MQKFYTAIVYIDGTGYEVSAVVSTFGDIWSLPIEFFFSLTITRLKGGMVLCGRCLCSPLPSGL